MDDVYKNESVEDEVIGEDESSEELNQLEDEGQGESAAADVVFDIDGQKVPFSKLSPDAVQAWYKDSINRAAWQKENTRRAQEVAEFKKKYDTLTTEYPEYERELREYRAWVSYMNNNPELAAYLKNYHQGRAAQGNPAVNNPTLHPEMEAIKRKLDMLEQEREAEREERERADALNALFESDKSLNREDFMKFVSEVTGKNDLRSLYSTLHNAYRGAKSGDLKKQVEQEVIDRIKKNKTLGVNTGGNSSSVNLPENIDSTQDYDSMFDSFKSELGIAD